ncbi:Hypothetical predicted protein [Pelobates cultripes]|uniref:Uncharacterized protein n=1 Tax=Pelobates cultripes TaxID=61616 RepID=A0AAD1QY00_PELCU|nr:Hypothetical predicted protein [Pelobates cultripes]
MPCSSTILKAAARPVDYGGMHAGQTQMQGGLSDGLGSVVCCAYPRIGRTPRNGIWLWALVVSKPWDGGESLPVPHVPCHLTLLEMSIWARRSGCGFLVCVRSTLVLVERASVGYEASVQRELSSQASALHRGQATPPYIYCF